MGPRIERGSRIDVDNTARQAESPTGVDRTAEQAENPLGGPLGEVKFAETGNHFGKVFEVEADTKDVPPSTSDAVILDELTRRYGDPEWKEARITRTGDRMIIERQIDGKTSRGLSARGEGTGKKGFHHPFDVFTHHNQALDVMRVADEGGKIKGGGVLLHFDTHSDVIVGVQRETIANYLSALVVNGMVSEVYWVMPQWAKERPDTFYSDSGKFVDAWLLGKEKEYTLFAMGGRIYATRPDGFDEGSKDCRAVTVHKTTADELPQFRKSREKYVDVDADYFSNTGFDTSSKGGSSVYNASYGELGDLLERFSGDLRKHNIYPSVVMLSRSPNYTPDEDIGTIEGYFKKNYGPDEYIPDDSTQYKHGHNNDIEIEMLGSIKDAAVSDDPKVEVYVQDILSKLSVRGYGHIVKLWNDYVNDRNDFTRDALLAAINSAVDNTSERVGG